MSSTEPPSPLRQPPDWVLWLIFVLVNLVTWAALRRELPPGEFGSLQTVFAVVGLMATPIVALSLALHFYLGKSPAPERAEYVAALRSAGPVLVETACLACGGASVVLLLFLLPLLDLPRASLRFFTLLAVFGVLGALLGRAAAADRGWSALWPKFVLGAAWVRLIASALLGWKEPWAESGVAALILASLLPAFPALRARLAPPQRLAAGRLLRDPDFARQLAAMFSLTLGLFLLTNGDRLVAQSWFGEADNNNFGFVNWRGFDDYHTAGALVRTLLWALLPLLWPLYLDRSALTRTTMASLRHLWIYLAAWAGGAVLLILLAPWIAYLFSGRDTTVAALLPHFVVALLPAAILQGLGVFALASGRRIECHTLGAASVVGTLVLYLAGRQPLLMLAYMFGLGLILLMLFLGVAVVRYARTHP